MTTDVILLKQVKDLGAEGDKVKVASGYARNYLLPQRLATLATRANVRQLAELKKRRTEREAAELATVRELADKLTKLTLSISVATGPGGKLFGAVTTHHISEALVKEGFEIDHHKLELKHPIHALGTFDVDVKLHPEVTANVKFSIVSKTAPGTEETQAAEAAAKSPRGRKPRPEAPAKAAEPVEEKPAIKKGGGKPLAGGKKKS
ncbi:MAG: 50S ribosomal protein L9 [Verrucomicrobia bacterium]|nr:50S ribosomal protein L9 [Verrucomicrobiota bacterium]